MPSIKIEVVCYANYCRSPVFAAMLNQINPKKINATSSGINPMHKLHMDPRSSEYLLSKNINANSHIPRKFTREIGLDSDIVIACDYEIFTYLKDNYRLVASKVNLISKHSNFNKPLHDPFKIDSVTDYFKVLDTYILFKNDWKDSLE